MFESEKKVKSYINGLLTGGILGGLTALLFAPKSGKELRRDISDKTGELLDDTNVLIENAKETASKIISDAKKYGEEIIADAKKKVGDITSGAENLLTQGKEIVEDEVHKVKDAIKSGAEAYNEERSKMNTARSMHEENNKSKKSTY